MGRHPFDGCSFSSERAAQPSRGAPVGPSFVIERLEFQRDGVWYARYFKGLVTFLVGHSKSGKSTAIEALLYPLGLTNATVMRDLGRVDRAVRVPPLLIIDSPLADLGSTGLDHETSLRLIDTLISIADDPSPDGYACQVIAATNDALPRAYPGVREIHLTAEQRFFDDAPVLDS